MTLRITAPIMMARRRSAWRGYLWHSGSQHSVSSAIMCSVTFYLLPWYMS